jgi:signal transduction histidine kinase
MVAETRGTAIAGGEHVVHFYERDAELVRAVGPYLAAAVRDGQTAVVVATDAHRRALEAELEAGGVQLSQARADGRLLCLDAATALSAFMSAGRIDREAFHAVIGGLVRGVAARGRAISAYGEMVALLWDAGNVLATIELETLWNELQRELAFSLHCSYRAMSAAGSGHEDSLQHVCQLHSSVGTPSPERGVSESFPAEPSSPGHARRMSANALRQWGHGDRLVDDVTLVVSELASNAVRHARSPFSVTVRMRGSMVCIAVEDRAPLASAALHDCLTVQPLHGLGLIDALCAGWGIEDTHDGKIVWAQLTCEAPVGRA